MWSGTMIDLEVSADESTGQVVYPSPDTKLGPWHHPPPPQGFVTGPSGALLGRNSYVSWLFPKLASFPSTAASLPAARVMHPCGFLRPELFFLLFSSPSPFCVGNHYTEVDLASLGRGSEELLPWQ